MAVKGIAILLGSVLYIGMCSVAQAAIVWDESINGDLPRGDAPTPELVLPFAFGVNRIIGSSFFDTTLQNIDPDSFYFTLPQRGMLRAITYRFQVTSTPAPIYLETDYDLVRYPGWDIVLVAQIGLANELGPGGGGVPVVNPFRLTGLALNGPEYEWFHAGFGGNGVNRWTYQTDFLVTATPEPPLSALLAVGAASLIIFGRRNRAATANLA